jgi:hypothetical protein
LNNDIEDLEEQSEFLLNFRKEKGDKICVYVINHLINVLEVREIVEKNNVFAEDYEELPFVKNACEAFAVGEEEN